MIFNSVEFLVFGPLFFLLWLWAAPRAKARWVLITGASFIFYGWWDWRYTLLLAGTGLVDFYMGLVMERYPHRRKPALVMSIVSNIGVLAFFKYWGLFADTVNAITAYAGGSPGVPLLNILLPVGISFYTFQSLSYAIDVYRGEVKPTHNLWHFFAFLSLFTQLVAGPIVRPKDLLPQLETWKKPDGSVVFDGLRLVVFGFFKKMFIADNLGPALNSAIGAPVVQPSGPFWWMIVFMFSIRIYTDFSGYSDIARGLTKWMGYELPVNFRHPLSMSSSLTDFWNRWHITLSTWFRDYVYQPLGGSSRNRWIALRNLWITMLLIGLWHGAQWKFVVFGAANALFLTLERVYNWPKALRRTPGTAFLVSLLVFVEFGVIGIWFGALTVEHGLQMLSTMFNPTLFDLRAVLLLGSFPLAVTGIAAAMEITNCYLISPKVRESKAFTSLEPILLAVLIVVTVFLRGPGDEFIYFQF